MKFMFLSFLLANLFHFSVYSSDDVGTLTNQLSNLGIDEKNAENELIENIRKNCINYVSFIVKRDRFFAPDETDFVVKPQKDMCETYILNFSHEKSLNENMTDCAVLIYSDRNWNSEQGITHFKNYLAKLEAYIYQEMAKETQ